MGAILVCKDAPARKGYSDSPGQLAFRRATRINNYLAATSKSAPVIDAIYAAQCQLQKQCQTQKAMPTGNSSDGLSR